MSKAHGFREKLWQYHTPLQVFTNGNAFTPELSDYMLSHGMSSMWCSLHGQNEKTYHSIMRGSDYGRVMANLMHLKHSARRIRPDFRLTLVFCAMRRNIEQLPAYVAMAHRLGAKEIQVNYLQVNSYKIKLDHEAMCFYPHLYDTNVLEAKRIATHLGIHLKHQRLFGDGPTVANTAPCYRPWEHLYVYQDGRTTPCCGGCGSLGNIFEQGFSELWNSPKVMDMRARINSDTPPKACKACIRGRENPWDVKAHLSKLANLGTEDLVAQLEHILEQLPDSVEQPVRERLLQVARKQDTPAPVCS